MFNSTGVELKGDRRKVRGHTHTQREKVIRHAKQSAEQQTLNGRSHVLCASNINIRLDSVITGVSVFI